MHSKPPSLVKLKFYDNLNDYAGGSIRIYEILNSLLVNPEMEPSTIPLPRLEALEVICQATKGNQNEGGRLMAVV